MDPLLKVLISFGLLGLFILAWLFGLKLWLWWESKLNRGGRK